MYERTELLELERHVADFVRTAAPEGVVRHLMAEAGRRDDAAWRTAVGMGLLEPEAGAAGAEPLVVGVEAVARGLALPALPSAVLAVAAMRLGDATTVSVADEVLAGDRLPTFATRGSAREEAGGWSGAWEDVVCVDLADTVVLLSRPADEPALLLVSSVRAHGVTVTVHETFDQTRRVGTVELDGARPYVVALTPRQVDVVTDLATVVHAADQVGAAAAMLDLSLAHARARWQFGRPIGSFQAVKHQLAELALAVELARSAVRRAARELDAGTSVRVSVPVSGALAADAVRRAASTSMQVHGGIGFSWEHQLHLFLKRAKASMLAGGAAIIHRRDVARRLNLAAAGAGRDATVPEGVSAR